MVQFSYLIGLEFVLVTFFVRASIAFVKVLISFSMVVRFQCEQFTFSMHQTWFKLFSVSLSFSKSFNDVMPSFPAMIKPFMSKHLFDIVHVHPVGMDFHEHFFEKFIPKSSMPSDYGGDLASLSELHEKNCKVLCSFKEYFELEEKHLKHQLDSDHVDDDKSHTEL